MRFIYRLLGVAALALGFSGDIPAQTSSAPLLINCATNTPCTTSGPPLTGTGDKAYIGAGKINADLQFIWANGQSINGIYSYEQLASTYTSANVTGNPIISTTNTGPVWWTGSMWVPTSDFTIVQTAIPIGVPPSGTVGTNGAVTFNTPLDQAYPSIYMSFPTGALFTNSPLGIYYLSCSTTTTCTAYNNMYLFGTPVVPSTPTPISSAAIGAYTQNLSCGTDYCAAILLNGVLPGSPTGGSILGNNGSITYEYKWQSNNSAAHKYLSEFFTAYGGGPAGEVNVDSETTAQFRGGSTVMREQGNTNTLVSLVNPQGDVGTGTGFTTHSLSTARQQTVSFKGWTSSGADWMILESAKITASSSLFRDTSAIFAPAPSGPTLVPTPAAAAGYNTNLFFLRPSLTDLSFSDTPSTALYAALTYGNYSSPGTGGYVETSTPYTPSGQVLTIKGGLAGNSYAPVVTERHNGTQGALPYITAANGFYAEFEFWLSDNIPDHWPALWMLPREHDPQNGNQCTGPNSPTGYECYEELDVDEGGLQTADQGQAQYHGPQQTMINWFGYAVANTSFTVSGTSTTAGNLSKNWTGPTSAQKGTIGGTSETINVINNSAAVTWNTALGAIPAAGTAVTFTNNGGVNYNDHTTAPYDWTIPHRFGVLYAPTAQTVSFYVDEVLQDTYSTSAFDYAINPYHYYMIANGSSRGLDIPYNLYVGFMAVWTP